MAAFQSVLVLSVIFLSALNVAITATCSDCSLILVQLIILTLMKREQKAMRVGMAHLGQPLNGGDVSAASDLYRDGVGCGACYQVRCSDNQYCSDKGVTVVITDQGSGPSTDFMILSRRAFGWMAQSTDAAASLLNLGVCKVQPPTA